MEGQALVAAVRRPGRPCSPRRAVRVAVVDYGAKLSILRRLSAAGASVTVYPHSATADDLAGFDGVVLSNGPGDPEPLRDEVEAVEGCSGASDPRDLPRAPAPRLATGHRTFKLPFGHRGANPPVLDRRTGRVLVTSQNHGFAVEPSDAEQATHVSSTTGRSRASTSRRTRALGPVPPEAVRPARRLAHPRGLGRGSAS